MFGFSKKEKLEKIHKQIRDASLREVVERFADPEIIVPPKVKFDKNIAEIYCTKNRIFNFDNIEELNDRLIKITKENELEEGSELIYFAQSNWDALRKYALDLPTDTRLYSKAYAVEYLFTSWIKNVPEHYVIPILFPAKAGGKIEDFRIDREYRYAMMGGLFAILDSVETFKSIVSSFAKENPYFRDYPLQDI
ncbi:MAG: hypothetical protein NXH86_17250 [Flavobacteriaceae bacterium]|nr:hypothetical protein [Flavobacteriaceae bacterium]